MALSGDRLHRTLNTYDAALRDVEDATLERIYAALDAAGKELERQLTKSYAKNQGIPGLLPNQRALLIRQEIAEYMALLRPEEREAIEANFERMLATGAQFGIDMSQELVNATTNSNVQSFASVPVEAIRFQAQDAAKRLYRWSDEYQQKISGIVEMHLAVGSGPQKVASTLRQELGITKGRAEAIARTEMLSSFDSATRENYKRNNVELCQRVSTNDRRLCGWCAARAGKVYRVEEAPGPLHINCRCSTVPWRPEWAVLGLVDNAWMEQHAADVQAQAIASGQKLNNGPAPFERANGLQPPKPVWSPGEPLPALPEKPKAVATPKAPKPPKEPKPPKPPSRMPSGHAIALTKQWSGKAVDTALSKLTNPGAKERVQALRQFATKHDTQAIFYDTNKPFHAQKETIRKGLRHANPRWDLAKEMMHTKIGDEAFGYTWEEDNHIVVGVSRQGQALSVDAEALNGTVKGLIAKEEAGDRTPFSTVSHIPDSSDTAAFITYLHEMGHQVHFKAGIPMPPEDATAPLTRYGGKNVREYFAEHFAMWLIDAEALRATKPGIARWIEDTMEKATAAPKWERRIPRIASPEDDDAAENDD